MYVKSIEETVSYNLAQLYRAHRNAANALLRESGLHAGQETVLLHLWAREGITQGELAERLGIEAPTVSRMLQRMENAGLVERRNDPGDARVTRVFLTPNAHALREQVEQAWSALESRTLAGLTSEESRFLRRVLRRMYDNLTAE